MQGFILLNHFWKLWHNSPYSAVAISCCMHAGYLQGLKMLESQEKPLSLETRGTLGML
jgi:hypothetical protein